MMSKRRQKLGRWGEEKAAQYLQERGYTILGRNVYTQYGELDIVASQPLNEATITTFIEVKTRTSTAFGYPEEAITALKREHILSAAQAYLQEHLELGEAWQVDVIAIQRPNADTAPEIRHFQNVFS